jgi:hypothetical protein
MSDTEEDTPTPRVGALDTAKDVRKELGRLYRAGRRGDIPAANASRLGSILGLILRGIELVEIEERIERLEGKQ